MLPLNDFIDVTFQALLVYACGVFTNSGNYKGFGDSKFVPNLECDRLEALVMASAAHKQEPEVIKSLWKRCSDAIYSLSTKHQSLGLGEKVHKYFN
jgi:dipeptidyl-peptidase-3